MFSPLKQCLYAFVIFFLVDSSDVNAQINVVTRNWRANDLIYDRHRDVIYATVGSSVGAPNGNSMLVLAPDTLNILDRIFVGSEPNKLAISNDGSRVYVAIDGATSFRYYEPSTGQLGPMRQVRGNSYHDHLGDPAVVEDMVVSPTDPKVVIVSADELGSSASGKIEIYNDTGRVGGVSAAYTAESLAFVDANTLVGLNNSDTGFESTRFKLDDTELTVEQEARGVIGGFRTTIEESGGLIFSSNGGMMDPTNLTRLGTFRDGSGAMEASQEDGLIYYFDYFGLRVFDTTTFLEVDYHLISPPRGAITLISAGENRLAYLRPDRTVGVITGVQLTPPPLPEINIRGTIGDDHLVFDLTNRNFTLNGVTTSVPFDINTFRFNGFGGQDSVRYIGNPSDSELAVLRSNFFSVAAENFSFSARNCSDVVFASDSDDDFAIFFDSVDQDNVLVTPGRVALVNNLARLVATSISRAYVYSQGGDDTVRFRGNAEAVRLAANLKQRRISFSGQDFFVNTRGFFNAQVNAGIGNNDSGSIIDSNGDDFYYATGNFGYLFNDDGIAYSFREIENLNIRSTSGNDIGALQQTTDSNVRGNTVWSSLYGPGFNHNLFNFGRVDVREE